jgi:hypothetical protein
VRDQLVVGSAFDDLAMIEHEDEAGLSNRAEPVRNNEACAAL